MQQNEREKLIVKTIDNEKISTLSFDYCYFAGR